jgi:F-type H+-transporting ATPase subunit gamma
MPTLKALRTRINSVKSTQKITSAMKMVAASKLRRAQSHAEGARPYAERMERMLVSLAMSAAGSPTAPRLLIGTGKEQVHLLIPVTSDRGLAGAFSSNVGRLTRRLARQLEGEGKTVMVLPIGRKGREFLRRELPGKVIGDAAFSARKTYAFADALGMARRVIEMLAAGQFDVCTVVFNRFASVMTQIPTVMQLVPAPVPQQAAPSGAAQAVYEFEPDEETMLARLLPQNLAIQIYRTLLESSAGFYGAQMTAMDSATRNAGDMIRRLSLHYNRVRQANITNQLIEIISGAEAV